jgi:hypothetical protein
LKAGALIARRLAIPVILLWMLLGIYKFNSPTHNPIKTPKIIANTPFLLIPKKVLFVSAILTDNCLRIAEEEGVSANRTLRYIIKLILL